MVLPGRDRRNLNRARLHDRLAVRQWEPADG